VCKNEASFDSCIVLEYSPVGFIYSAHSMALSGEGRPQLASVAAANYQKRALAAFLSAHQRWPPVKAWCWVQIHRQLFPGLIDDDAAYTARRFAGRLPPSLISPALSVLDCY
jgi:hypothetical protein